MAKIVLPSVASGYNVSTINANFQALATDLNNKVLYRASPPGEANQMTSPLDMNSQRILNLPAPTSDLEPLRRIDAADIASQSAAALAAAALAVSARDDAEDFATAAGSSASAAAISAGLAQTARTNAEAASAAAEDYAQDAYDNSRLSVGVVNTGAPGSTASVLINGVPGSQVIDFTIPRGDVGPTGLTGPAGPTGSGTGDVIGPVTSVVDRIVLFASTDGKQIKDSGVLLSSKQDTLTFTPENVVNKGVANGYAPLDGDGKVPSANLPTIAVAEVITPTNTSPANGATDVAETPTFTASAFFSNYSATHQNTQVQVSTTNVFTSPLFSSGDVAPSTSYTIASGILVANTQYYWRIRYKNSRGIYSDWSTPTSFNTAVSFNNYIATPAATPAIGASFEGGFYAGMVWSNLASSSTSRTLGTGNVVFAVPDMSTTPIVYAGQELEVRSAANPANKFVGVVSGASGTNLTVNVSSISGSGTFSDWRIMSKFRIIVAPKATGESQSNVIKNAATALPSGCNTWVDGKSATAAMLADGNSTVYPAAYWATALSIGGRSDWYIPARDEQEVLYRSLRPAFDNNYVGTDRPAAGVTMLSNGEIQGTSAQGQNPNSSPAGAAYTLGVPSSTSVVAFQTGGSEAFTWANQRYVTSTQSATGSTWAQFYGATGPGAQSSFAANVVQNIRAIRRSII